MRYESSLVPYYQGDVLEHYGIKGMKWGIRRTPEQLGHKTEKLKKKNRVLEDRVSKIKVNAANYGAKAARLEQKSFVKETTATSDRALAKAKKIQYKANKFKIKEASVNKAAAKAERKILKNERLMKSYEMTIKGMQDGTIKQGESFVENFFMRYKVEE